MKRAVIAVFVALMFNTMCYSQSRKTLNKWLGHDKSELIQVMGLPEQQGSDGSGGEILVFRSSDNWTGEKHLSFYLNEDGKIYKWRTSPIPTTPVIYQQQRYFPPSSPILVR